MERLGYGAATLTEMAKKRSKGIVYVYENCFGYELRRRMGTLAGMAADR